MTTTQATIGERLREARMNLQLSQEEVANAIGLSRTAIVKIEAGDRAVSSVELSNFAQLYRRNLTDLVSTKTLSDDPFTLLGRVQGNEDPEPACISESIDLLKEAVKLEGFLGDRFRTPPPAYQLQAPTNIDEAVDQGRETATLERRRLGLGKLPIPDVAEVISCQGIWAAAVPLPENTMGLFVSHPSCGLAVFVNDRNKKARRRFSYAHEYAHALMDRDEKPEPTSALNAKTLRERRANAFASEFLMPAAGIHEALDRTRKGGSSRSETFLFDLFTDEYEHVTIRHDAGAMKIGIHDVAFLAHEFNVSYEMTAIRLREVDCIRKVQLDSLLERKDDAYNFMRALKMEPIECENQPHLARQLMELAIEGYRREKISRGTFVNACMLAKQDPEQMLLIARLDKGD